MSRTWDAIVVGARCAGSPCAMLLAQRGYKVLLVDRATFPSDTISTHLLHPPGVAALARWGLLDRLEATGCPPIDWYTYDFGAFAISGAPGPEGANIALCPRRTVLDKLLLDAAGRAGVEIREGFTVDELTLTGASVSGIRGHTRAQTRVAESARVVIGADGRHSTVANMVRPEVYRERPPVQVSYYSYFSDLPTDGFETYVRPYRAWAAFPTHAGLTVVIAGRPIEEFDNYRKDIEGNYFEAFELAPAFAARLRKAKRETRFAGTSVPGYFRKPYGPGWALVGDAGYNKDFITAMGITDAFRDAELCSQALHEALSGARSFEDAMRTYHRRRDEDAVPIYDFTYQFASLAPPQADLQRLLNAIHGNRAAMDGFIQVTSGMLPPSEFFSEANVREIFAAADDGKEANSERFDRASPSA